MTIEAMKQQDLLLLECISGSRAYGLATKDSDTDIKGVFYLPKEQFYGLNYVPQVSNKSNDIVYYELGRFIELLAKNNPNILELLATPDDCVLYQHPLMDQLKAELFLSRLCEQTFGSYAMTQVKKARGLNKKILNPVEPERKSVLDFCYVVQGQGSVLVKAFLKKAPDAPRGLRTFQHCPYAGSVRAIPRSSAILQRHCAERKRQRYIAQLYCQGSQASGDPVV